MVTRADLVAHALKDNGYLDGVGYPGPGNRFDTYLGRSNEYWCFDTVTGWYAELGIPLPLMQPGMPGMQTGGAYCPDGVQYGRDHGIVILSTQAKPGDPVFFNWSNNGVADHIELCVSNDGAVMRTIGGDSGPSNVDGYRGEGGVHLHDWTVPNSLIIAVLDADRLVTFQSAPSPQPQGDDEAVITPEGLKQIDGLIANHINPLGKMLEAPLNADGTPVDPTHVGLRQILDNQERSEKANADAIAALNAKLDQLIAGEAQTP